jgi:short-subunit dehydrogenase
VALNQQVVLVTGCSTGIGRALVRELAARGHVAFATARRTESLQELRTEGFRTLPLDVNDKSSIHEAVEAVVAAEGRIDVVINNAGMNLFGPVMELPLDEIRSIFETNVLGLVAVSQAVFPKMAEQRKGLMINIGSIVGVLPTPFAGAYCATKSSVHMLSEVIRMEVAPFGIDVVVVQPGGVRSNIAESGARGLERFRDPSSRYHGAYEGIHKRAFASQDNPMVAEDFARELVAQAFVTKAPRLIRLGTGSDYLPRLAESPPDQRDTILSQTYGLAAIAEPPETTDRT